MGYALLQYDVCTECDHFAKIPSAFGFHMCRFRAMQVFENVTYAIGDAKGNVTFEQLMLALEGTEDDGNETQEDGQQNNVPPTIQPSAAEALKQQKQKKRGGSSSSLTTSSQQIPPKSSMWKAKDKGEKVATHTRNSSSSLSFKQEQKAPLVDEEPVGTQYSKGYNQRCESLKR